MATDSACVLTPRHLKHSSVVMYNWVIFALLFGAVAAQNGNTSDSDNVIVTSVLVEPYLIQQNGKHDGYMVDLLSEVMTRINKKFEIRIAADRKFGSKQDDGTWNGMIGEVVEGDADMIAAPLTISGDRMEVLDFSKPFMTSGLLGVTSQPQPESKPDFFLIFKPFSVGVWFLILVCFIVFSLLLFVINQFHPSEWRQAFSRGKGSEDNVKAFGVQGSFWLAFSTLNLQGYEKIPRSLAGRILVAFWFFFVLFTIVLYIGSMVNFLAAANQDPITPKVAKDLDEHVSNGGQVVVLEGGYAESFFRGSNVRFYKDVASSLVTVSSMATGLAQVRASNGQLALVTDSPTVQYARLRQPCDLMTVGGMLNSVGFAFGYAKGDALKEDINSVLVQLQEDGELARLQKKWWTDRKECDAPSTETDDTQTTAVRPVVARPVSLNTYSGGIIIFMLGILLSSLVAVIEYAYRNHKNKPRKTKEQLLEAEEGQALNETAKTVLDKTAVEDENEKEMQEIKKKEDDTGPELEPEDKEEKEEQKPREGADNKVEEDTTDKIEELKS